MRAYIIDIGQEKTVAAPKGTKSVVLGQKYVVLIETGIIENGKPKFQINFMEEKQLVMVTAQQPNLETINFECRDGRVVNKYKDASLRRFNQKGYKVKPFVVLSEIHNDKGALLGYRYSTNNGYTYMRKTEDFIRDCEQLMAKANANIAGEVEDEFKPVQNMKFISKDAASNKTGTSYLSIYIETNPLPVEVLVSKDNKYAKPVAPTVAPASKEQKKKKSAKDALASIYTKEQLAEIKSANDSKVDISIISNPKLSAEQMRIIWTTERNGQLGRKFADPSYPADYMQWLALMLGCGVDIDPVLNPRYNAQQAAVILGGIFDGLDVNEYADPELPAEYMERKKMDLYDGLWGRGAVIEGTKFKPSNENRQVIQPLRKA